MSSFLKQFFLFLSLRKEIKIHVHLWRLKVPFYKSFLHFKVSGKTDTSRLSLVISVEIMVSHLRLSRLRFILSFRKAEAQASTISWPSPLK